MISSRRVFVLRVTVALAVPVSLAQLALGLIGVVRAVWQVVAVLLLWAVGQTLARTLVPGLRWALLPSLVVATAPLALVLEGAGPVEHATLLLLPLAVSTLFFDHFDIVGFAVISGIVANTLWLRSTGFTSLQLAGVVAGQAAAAAVAVVTAWWMRAARNLEVAAEQARGQALRMSEARRAHTERLAIVGRLASGVAHEINNPLAFVKANVSVLRNELYGPHALSEIEVREILEETVGGIERIAQIISDLRAFSRDSRDEIEPVDLKEVVEAAARLATVRLPTGVKPLIDIPPGLLVRANHRKLSQVVLNLLVNAGEALEEAKTKNGVVTVRAEQVDEGVVLSVEDNGPGLPAEVQQRLFEPFFTTKPVGKGTGLGLALSREYLAAFDGTIKGMSAPGGGARFLISLRAAVSSGDTPVPGELRVEAKGARVSSTAPRVSSAA